MAINHYKLTISGETKQKCPIQTLALRVTMGTNTCTPNFMVYNLNHVEGHGRTTCEGLVRATGSICTKPCPFWRAKEMLQHSKKDYNNFASTGRTKHQSSLSTSRSTMPTAPVCYYSTHTQDQAYFYGNIINIAMICI